MLKRGMNLRRWSALIALAALATTASAFMSDAQIVIDRALNSPTLTVRYDGASVALVELRINGRSIATRQVNGNRTSGETNFTLDVAGLGDGENEVEIRLFDRNGRQVGSQKTSIAAEGASDSPVYLIQPKMGQTVQGPVEIRVGFGRDMRNTYVSFFVNNQIKSMVNTPPFTYLWDTTREANGWHEVEAWVIDETSNTFKTRKIRIFVNNPGGRTDRRATPPAAPAQNPPVQTPPVQTPPAAAPVAQPAVKNPAPVQRTATPAVKPAPVVRPAVPGVGNRVNPQLAGGAAGTKPVALPPAIATGVKEMTPTGTRNVVVAQPKPTVVARQTPAVRPTTSVTNSVTTAARTLSITKGQRIPNLASFAVVFNSQFVDFDVNPRVDNGVPMTPFRHLIEKAGGEVKWENADKQVDARAEGREVMLRIGDRTAKVNKLPVELELAPYIDRGRTIVPLSFLRDVLQVEIEYDRETGHVLITSRKRN